jgi:ATP-binding cassette subfamily F protein 3
MSLQIQNLRKTFAARTLFSDVSFPVNPGERVALVGSNGSGKTTLMRIILGREHADDGRITSPRDSRIGYLPQEIFLAQEAEFRQLGTRDLTLWELVSQAFARLHDIEARIADIDERMAAGDFSEALQEQRDALQIRFERAGGYSREGRMIRVMKGLGFPEDRFHDPLKHFSGGWQMRAYFARLLLSDPDFLLLDEPTNYLDIASIQFLEEYLTSFPGGILVVSHDRYFLDALATSVVALVPEGARVFRGNYSDFLLARETWAQEAEASQRRQAKEIDRIQRFIDRFRYKASKASAVQSRIKMLEKMDRVQTLRDQRVLDFSFIPCPESGEIVLQGGSINRAYDSHQVLSDITFSVARRDRLAIIGENGTGKSTLMRIIAGQDLAFQGELKWGHRVMPGYFAQDEEISFEKDESVWDRMLREAPLDKVPELRSLLGMFLFSGDMVDRPVKALSGGEKSRLGLARLLLRPGNLLLLDEPTNHLDIAGREALLDALEAFPGTLIFVSHDRFFLDSLATKILALDNGRATLYEGDYSQYLWARQHRLDQTDPAGGPLSSEGSTNRTETSEGQEAWKDRKRRSNQRKRLEKELEGVETLIHDLEINTRALETRLAAPAPGTSSETLRQWSQEYESLQNRLNEAMKRWEDLQLALEEQD